jgi:hypothetical protein
MATMILLLVGLRLTSSDMHRRMSLTGEESIQSSPGLVRESGELDDAPSVTIGIADRGMRTHYPSDYNLKVMRRNDDPDLPSSS